MFETLIEITKNLSLLTLVVFGFVYLKSFEANGLKGFLGDVVIGLLFGLLITIVMLDPIRLSEGATFDPRGGPAVLAGVFGGPLGGIVAAIIGSLARWYLVGGPVAAGGVVGFLLYGLFGIIAGYYIKKKQIEIGWVALVLLALLATIFVLPAFFVSADIETGVAILKKAGPVLIVNNIVGTLIVGLFVTRANQWTLMRSRLVAEQNENARLALIARNTTNGVIITDLNGRTEWINEGFVRLTGYSLNELFGKKPGDILQGIGTDPKVVEEMSSHIKNGESFQLEVLNYHKLGTPYWVQIYCQPFTDHNGAAKFMAIEADITDRKEIDDLKSEFVALVSHELRTPLTSILGSISLMHGGAVGPLTDQISNLMTIAKTNTERLVALVNDILDFEKLQSGRMEFHFKNLDLVKLVEEAIELNSSFAEQFGIRFKLADTLSGLTIKGDRARLQQVIANLLSNAAKFSPEGEVVNISIKTEGTLARVQISDRGPGIPEHFKDKVFDRFTQAETGDERTVKGTGLGLSISKRIVEEHSGSIGFDTDLQTGATFFFDIPLTK